MASLKDCLRQLLGLDVSRVLAEQFPHDVQQLRLLGETPAHEMARA